MSECREVRIDELVLAGFDRVDCARLGRSLEQSLARLFAERGVPRRLAQATSEGAIAVPPIALTAAASPEAIAADLARALYDGLDR
jgi:hypothetical protein